MVNDSSIPSLQIIVESNSIHIVIPVTQAQLEDQGYTYNQAGFSYNQPGVMYGGIYNQNQDVIPLLSMASLIIPSIAGFTDIYGKATNPSGGSGLLIGILGMLYP